MKARVARREALVDFLLCASAEDSPRPFPEQVIALLLRVVPCNSVAYRAWNESSLTDSAYALVDQAPVWSYWQRYPEFRRDDPFPSQPAPRPGDSGPIAALDQIGRPLVLSDAVTARALRHTGLYTEMMRPLGVRDVLKIFLPTHRKRGSALVFDTTSAFLDEDREVVQRLAPALAQFERNARARSLSATADLRLERLTPRELEVLARAASGEANARIAAALFVSPNTVRKHLQRIYEKLEVPNRAAATAVYARSDATAAGRTNGGS